MYSQRKFTPGSHSNANRLIHYITEYNARNPNNPKICGEYGCSYGNVYNKNVLNSDSSSQRLTNNQWIAYLCRTNNGGSTQYGNFYLGEPLNLNYLGRIPGMSGGGESPPVNKF